MLGLRRGATPALPGRGRSQCRLRHLLSPFPHELRSLVMRIGGGGPVGAETSHGETTDVGLHTERASRARERHNGGPNRLAGMPDSSPIFLTVRSANETAPFCQQGPVRMGASISHVSRPVKPFWGELSWAREPRGPARPSAATPSAPSPGPALTFFRRRRYNPTTPPMPPEDDGHAREPQTGAPFSTASGATGRLGA